MNGTPKIMKNRLLGLWPVLLLLVVAPASSLGQEFPPRVPTFVEPSGVQALGVVIQSSHVSTNEVRDAVDLIADDIVSISFGSSDDDGYDVFATAVTDFPTEGSDYLVLSSGKASSTFLPNNEENLSTELGGLNTAEGEDLVQVTFVLQPPETASCLAFDFAFYSEEFPEFVGSGFNDVFLAEFGQSTFQQVGSQVIAPNNFAFDTMGNVVSVNTVFGVTAGNADGTTYDGGTPLLTAKTPLDNPGDEITIILSIMDLGDSIYDSTTLVDNFRWLFGVACEPGADADTDRDALLDGWETNGIDFDGDGTVDLDLPAMGADARHKDIFVEIDYMVESGAGGHTHKPKADALKTVIDTFANAPVSNPDGTTGIRVHIDAGSGTIMNPVTNATWGSRSRSDVLTHQDNLGTTTASPNCRYKWDAFDGIKGLGTAGSFDIERGDVFHYSIWAHSLADTPAACDMGSTSGIARGIPGSDFLVSLGGWDGDVGSVNQQAGTLLHELGHGLSFLHGGDDGVGNYEPNYLSIMNYAFQTRGLRFNNGDGLFDYSSFQLPMLDEDDLDETDGISGVAGAANYGTRFYDSGGVQRIVNDINGPIDWNRDGDGGADTSVNADINGSGSSRGVGYCTTSGRACFSNANCLGGGDVCDLTTVLDNTDNWDEIVYNGGAVGALGEEIVLPSETEVIEIDQIEDAAMPTPLAVSVVGPGKVWVAAGSTITYEIVVTNIGDEADTFDISASDDVGWADLSGLPSAVGLVPGESTVVQVEVSVPGGTPAGSEGVLSVRAASRTNPAMMDATEITTVVSIAAIDIKPGNDLNPVNPGSKGVIPVAILGSDTFDVADVDRSTIAFGPNGIAPAHRKLGHVEDVDDDGIQDLMLHFRTQETGMGIFTGELCLEAQTFDGQEIGDCDPVNIPGGACGLGLELVLAVLPLMWLRRGRRQS